MKKDKKKVGVEAHCHRHMKDHDPLRTENHKEYVAFLKHLFGRNIYKDKQMEKRHEAGDGPYFPPVDILFQSEKADQKIKEKYARSFELTRQYIGKRSTGITRRNFLRVLGLTSLAPLAAMGTACEDVEYHFVPEAAYRNLPTYIQREISVPDSTQEAKVSIVRQDSIEEMVRTAVESAGGLEEIQQGDTVLIKPNCVWYSGEQSVEGTQEGDAQVTTNPEVLRAVIRVIKERTAPKNIYVSDHSALFISTMFVMQQQGVYDVCMEEGVAPIAMEDWPHINFTSDKFELLQEPFTIARPLLNMDHMINVPVLKNHNMPDITHMAQYTCSIKAFVGLMAPSNRMFNDRQFHLYDLPRKVAELNLCRPWRMPNGKPGITMTIADATRILVSGGPHNSVFQEEMISDSPNIIIASKDRIACDSAAVSLLKHRGVTMGIEKDYIHTPVWAQPQLVHAGKLGLGVNDPNRIELEFKGVAEEEERAIRAFFNAPVEG